MKKFLLIGSIILLLAFVTTNLLSIGFMFEKYLPQERYYDGPQNNPSRLIEPFKLLLLGVGLIFLTLIGRKTFKG